MSCPIEIAVVVSSSRERYRRRLEDTSQRAYPAKYRARGGQGCVGSSSSSSRDHCGVLRLFRHAKFSRRRQILSDISVSVEKYFGRRVVE